MSIIVTGAGGFIGREVVRRLVDQGRDVVATDSRVPTEAERPGAKWIEGDLGDEGVQAALFEGGCEGLIHMAAVPGGAAESDRRLSRRVNIDATLDLLERAAACPGVPRVVFASTIATYGDPLPAEGVDDATPLRPRLIYGAHKAMVEIMVAALSRRGEIDGVSLRLPGVIARPRGASGMKSAFMSDIFHALRAREPFTAPVSPEATLWLASVDQIAANLIHALEVGAERLPASRALTLSALRTTMSELAAAAAAATGGDASTVRYEPDAALQTAFGTHPQLSTAAADQAGFGRDGSVADLAGRVVASLERQDG